MNLIKTIVAFEKTSGDLYRAIENFRDMIGRKVTDSEAKGDLLDKHDALVKIAQKHYETRQKLMTSIDEYVELTYGVRHTDYIKN